MLGDDITPASIRFQASMYSPVDDLVVEGQGPDGSQRRLSIGVRRDPALVRSDADSVALIVPYLRVLTGSWDEVRAGTWRIGLATASRGAALRQLTDLIGMAASETVDGAFRTEVGRSGRTNSGVRSRLGHVDALVEAASSTLALGSEPPASELTWRLLSNLKVTELRLEGADDTDRTTAVGRLKSATSEGTNTAADALFSRLVELAGRYAPSGAHVTESQLR
jgi:hypothetical protein